MKQFVLAACVAAFNLSATAQVAEADDDFDDFVEISTAVAEEKYFLEADSTVVEDDDFLHHHSTPTTLNDKKPITQTFAEQTNLKKYIESGYTVVEEDEEGCIILKRDKEYLCINPWLSTEVLVDKADFVELVDITGCGLAYGISVKNKGTVSVLSQKGQVLIPETVGDELLEVTLNPFKSNDNSSCAYAIISRNGNYYAVLSNGRNYELNMEKCQMGVMVIFGIRGKGIYCFTPESMEKPEYMFDVDDKDVKYEEGELLTLEGMGRYDYLGLKKYSNISPAVLVKKGNDYYLFPSGEKVAIKKERDKEIEVKLSNNQTAIFSGFLSNGSALKECIEEN